MLNKLYEQEKNRRSIFYNAIARDLRTSKYRKRVVRSRKTYTRKTKHRRNYGS